MPFGPTNGPVTFINFIYDVANQLKLLASLHGIVIGNKMNKQIIVNEIVSHGANVDTSLCYMECQLQICCTYWLSLRLKISFIFPKRFEFVGNYVC